MRIDADGFSFDFTNAHHVFVFDEKDKTRSTFHDAPMKAVDIIAEVDDAYVFVEMKVYDPAEYRVLPTDTDAEAKDKKDHLNWLKNYLKYKYRDTYLFRYAEDKIDKPTYYVCLLTLDNALTCHLGKVLQKELPVGKASKRWKREIASSCHVLNVASWNRSFPKWPVKRIP